MTKPKKPFLDLTPQEIAELLKDVKLEDLLPKKDSSPQVYYRCNLCRDTKQVLVCGGPSRPCPVCGPRY